jgi:uncharacterized membrane protein YfcA
MQVDGCYYDPTVNEEIAYGAPACSRHGDRFFGGVVSSLLGIGGGIINVPVMSQLMKVPLKATIATSSLLLCFTTMTGSLIYAFNGFIIPYVIAPLIISVYLGARLGATFAHQARSAALMVIFTIFLLITAAAMVLKALNPAW